MKNTVKSYIYWTIIGTLTCVVEVFCLALGFIAHIWFPFLMWLIFEMIIAGFLTKDYWDNFSYYCPNCEKYFKPQSVKEFIFAKHSLMERKLTCPYCGQKNMCDEIHEDDI